MLLSQVIGLVLRFVLRYLLKKRATLKSGSRRRALVCSQTNTVRLQISSSTVAAVWLRRSLQVATCLSSRAGWRSRRRVPITQWTPARASARNTRSAPTATCCCLRRAVLLTLRSRATRPEHQRRGEVGIRQEVLTAIC